MDHTFLQTTKTRYFKLSLYCLVLAQQDTSSTVTLYKSRDVKLFYFWMLWSGLFGLGRVDRPGILSVGSESGEAWGVKYNIQTGFRLSFWLLAIVFPSPSVFLLFFLSFTYLFTIFIMSEIFSVFFLSFPLSFIGHGVSIYSSISSFYFSLLHNIFSYLIVHCILLYVSSKEFNSFSSLSPSFYCPTSLFAII